MKDAQHTLEIEIGCCQHGMSPDNTELSTAIAAEFRGELRTYVMGCHNHLPQQQTSSCFIGQNYVTWPLPAER